MGRGGINQQLPTPSASEPRALAGLSDKTKAALDEIRAHEAARKVSWNNSEQSLSQQVETVRGLKTITISDLISR